MAHASCVLELITGVTSISWKEPAGDRSGHWVSHMCARNSPTETRICLESVFCLGYL